MVNIPFKEYGRVYAPLFVKPLDDVEMQPLDFKVDTGADTSTISKPDLIDLGFDMDWIHKNAFVYEENDKPKSASDERLNAGYIQLPLINLYGYEGKCWPFQIIIDEDSDFRNLLGRDLLTGFNYQFDNDNDVFTIDRAKTFKPRYRFLPKQEIHEIVSEL